MIEIGPNLQAVIVWVGLCIVVIVGIWGVTR